MMQQLPEWFVVLLRRLVQQDVFLLNALLMISRARGWRTAVLAQAVDLTPSTISKRIERARRLIHEEGLDLQDIADRIAAAAIPLAQTVVPAAPRVQAMIGGRQLPQQKIDELLAMQQVARRVNGSMASDRGERRESEKLTAELHRLITEEGYTPYYLARVLGRSHRAITSRLERHHYRDPCPSVAGTPSGEYRNRKIGDPTGSGSVTSNG